MRPSNDDQSRHTEPPTFPSERSESSPSVRHDSNANISSSPLGLHIVHQPDKLFGDIVFVHGFGGSPYKTWAWNQDEQDSFWPAWLPECDPTLATFRISTFGYNAKLKGSATSLDIVDFAKDLLFELSAAFDSQGQSRSRPLIFIAHSLGGLVVKKAYTLGKHDEQYKGIMQRVRGMIFLSTPHRGSQYAKMLKNILSTDPIGTCSKDCIAALALQSAAIQDINESFLTHYKDIKLCSVFETLKTHLTVRKIWLVDRDSAVLGYPNEQSLSMDANHHSICKYETRRSVNFAKIKSVLLIWAAQLLEEDGPPTALTNTNTTSVESHVRSILGIESPFDEPNASPSIGYPATCGGWLTENGSFKAWMASQKSSVFMLVGISGIGKTAISHSIIAHLRDLGIDSQYHFFDESNQLKRAVSYCLRRIAAQLAMTNEEFRSALFKQHEQSGTPMTGLNQNAHALWDRLFGDLLWRLETEKTLFWVLDGLDEADVPSLLLLRLASLSEQMKLKVLISCRPLQGVSLQDNPHVIPYVLKPGNTTRDMEQFVHDAVERALPDDGSLQESVRSIILRRASGSFLWVKLALELMQQSRHTQDDIVAALAEVPDGMSSIYARMLRAVEEQNPKTRELARHILLWVAFSWRPLLLSELEEALKPDFGRLTNLGMTISHICGNFITVDGSNASRPTANLIHTTARDFLLRQDEEASHWMDARQAHGRIAERLLSYLCNENWRGHFGSSKVSSAAGQVFVSSSQKDRLAMSSKKFPLLSYATHHWAYHFSKSPVAATGLMGTLATFMLNHSLTWIEGIALTTDMSNLVRSAHYMRAYIKRCSRSSVASSHWIQPWATDFLRVASNFAENLIQRPASIHCNVPQMCPVTSMIRRTFGVPGVGALRVTGMLPETWDDCIGTVSTMNGDSMRQVIAGHTLFFTLACCSGEISVWSTATCQHIKTLEHGEYVSKIVLSRSGSLLAAVSFRSYCVWEAISGRRIQTCPREKGVLIQDVRFSADETSLVIIKQDGTVEFLDFMSPEMLKTKTPYLSGLGSRYGGCPWRASLSPDTTRFAASWRGRPPLVWSLEDNQHAAPLVCRTTGQSDLLMYPEQLAWRADTGSLLILCSDTSLVEWRIPSDEIIELPIKARDMNVSNDGSMLITCDHQSAINLYTFPNLALIYSLRNSGDSVVSMAFSPDNQRFYDVRGSSCNVWEPDALARPCELDVEEDLSSYTGSFTPSTEPVIADLSSESSDVTAICISPDPGFFACGRSDGSVSINETDLGCKLRGVAQHETYVTKLAWSPSGRHIASCDASSSVIVKKVTQREDGSWAVFRCVALRVCDSVRQFVWCASGRLLLIATRRRDYIWNVRSKVQVYSRPRSDKGYRHWMPDPSHPDTVLRVGSSGAAHWHLATGEEVGAVDESSEDKDNLHDDDDDGFPVASEEQHGPIMPDDRELPPVILWSCAVDSGRHRLVALSTHGKPYQSVFHTGAELRLLPLGPGDASQINLRKATAVPRAVAGRVKLLLSAVGNTLLFLGSDGWIYSYDLSQLLPRSSPLVLVSDGIQGLSRHFHVPKNWLNNPRAHLFSIGNNGMLLCPIRGGVAIVKNGLQIS